MTTTVLFAQVELCTDDDVSLGKTVDDRDFGDNSERLLDLDADQKVTAEFDRVWSLPQSERPEY